MVSVTRQWMLVLVITAALSVAVNAIVLSTLINRYFISFSTEAYNGHVAQLIDFSEQALKESSYSQTQLEMHFTSHLSDPINRIRLYDTAGNLLVDVRSDRNQLPAMMNHNMMDRVMRNAIEESEAFVIISQGDQAGQLVITRFSSIGDSMAIRLFSVSLIGNSLLSFFLVLALIFALGYFVSRRMSRDFRQTARQAVDIGLGTQQVYEKSRIKEIRTIQQSLEDLHDRLKLKQTSRKKLVDELIHQTRTPLTILKTHLEGIADGIIQPTAEEIRICDTQIDQITSMIANIGNMIDADMEQSALKLEQIELRQLLRQIVSALRMQFDQKMISLQLLNHEKIFLQTDPGKLSQVVYNLLTNAYKYTGSGGLVAVGYNKSNDQVMITVQDTGTGIAEADKEKIFDAYYRGINAGQTTGEGIGLYLVKDNLQQLGGQIDVASIPGKGTTFTIRLPAVPCDGQSTRVDTRGTMPHGDHSQDQASECAKDSS